MDVYYNQTYTSGSSFNNRYDQFNSDRHDSLPLFYQGYPSYYDAYQNTLRSYDERPSLLRSISKIPKWLQLAYEM